MLLLRVDAFRSQGSGHSARVRVTLTIDSLFRKEASACNRIVTYAAQSSDSPSYAFPLPQPPSTFPIPGTMSPLNPPRINTQDTGAHDLSESDDHFSSASEGEQSHRLSASATASTPITRVERVDDRPAHGEVPGTAAYALRTQDAVPDEIEVVPEGQRSRSATQSRNRAASQLSARSSDGPASRPQTPGGSPIPRTVVERVDDRPAHGEVEGTAAYQMRLQDAEPDEVIRAPREARSGVLEEGR